MKICAGILVSVLACAAQSNGPVRGEVRARFMEDLSWLTVRLDPPGAAGHGESAFVTYGGEFEFSNVSEGLYTLRLLDRRGNEITSQPLTVTAKSGDVVIQLPQDTPARPTGETASVARLRHRPNRPALQAARKAQKAAAQGDYLQAAEEWQRAIAADPEFSEAHANLGVQYSRLNRVTEAIVEFRKAVALDGFTAAYQANLAIGLAQSGQMDEAESWARSAVRRDGASPVGHYVLGCVLTGRLTTLPEAIRQLQIAAPQYARAHQMLAAVYQAQGKTALAAAERKQYEESQQTVDGHRADSWSTFLH